MKKTLVAAALVSAMGASATASADIIEISWSGLFTMVSPGGGAVVTNGGSPDAADAFGISSFVGGTMTFDTDAGTGSASLTPFEFSGNTASLTPGATTLTAIGDGLGGAGTLVLAEMEFNWGPNLGIPVYLVGDAAGFFGAGPYSVGQVITGGNASTTQNDMGAFAPLSPHVPTLEAGVPFAMTTLDPNQSGSGVLIGGGFPLTNDGVTGTPMATAPFPDHNAAFDITEMTITNITPSAIPVPAAVWLFGSGLLGLVGVARRKKSA